MGRRHANMAVPVATRGPASSAAVGRDIAAAHVRVSNPNTR